MAILDAFCTFGFLGLSVICMGYLVATVFDIR